MTSQSPRIYTYKITFEEVLYYYYGVHKEKKFGEYYMGSPYTHKWVWDFYTPKKQILEIFPFTDEGWLEAQKVEKRLIRPVFNADNWCLNKNVGGLISLEIYSKVGKRNYENNIGIAKLSKEELSENGKMGGKKAQELGVGIHGISKEKVIKNAKNGGQKAYELGVGIHGISKEEKIEIGKMFGGISGKLTYELGIGVHARTKEQMSEDGKKGGKISGYQKWKCTETGFITNAGNLTKYQKARGIDTNNRVRIQ
jgi:hypothetical protein